MSLFNRNKSAKSNQGALAEIALNAINDGVIMTDKNGIIEFVNPAAVTMTNISSASNALKFSYDTIIKLESKEGRELSEAENPLTNAMKTGQALEPFRGSLIVNHSDKRIPIAISVLIVNSINQERIITFRNITKELQEEGEQTEFISTASHEMRTPVATIDGYLSLALNPQTATIDERARGYLSAAEAASKHLGKLFQDLLDVTKLDDGRIRPNLVPAEMVELVKTITDDYLPRAKESKINFTFGSNEPGTLGTNRRMEQVVYSFVDLNFVREILDNLVDNALKYTPEGGSVYVNVRGDGDRVLINVTDTGIGISADDLAHIFQKFYRADNSDTRTIGGTGLGLYLVKQRVEAMGGKVWAESAFGEGSTFYVSLPRITSAEYEKRMIAVRQQQVQEQLARNAMSAPQPAPVAQPVPQPAQQPAPQPAQQPAPPVPPEPTEAPPANTPQPPQPPQQEQKEININVNGERK
ncbi:PAS domain-containing protein [Candidatus Saccharibacteria bacterium]|nr:PAS domain-containing protein [Candidatus Saccharibacteria bacterium]